MKKLYALAIAFALFLLFLVVVVIPQQGGNVPSTEIFRDALEKADPAYGETLPIQSVDIGAQGRSIIIAAVMLTHILFANLHLGGAWIAAITESFALRFTLGPYQRLARSFTLFNVMLFSAGSTVAAAGTLFFIALFPAFSGQIFHIYWWPLLAEVVLFGVQILLLYTYWFSWGRIRNSAHQFLGYGYAFATFFQTLMINTAAGGMLTPGGPDINWNGSGILPMSLEQALAWWLNPTLLILQLHRLFAALSYVGFLIAMIAMFHFLDQKERAPKRYWDWVGSYGIIWGLIGLIVQPVLGLIYMRTIVKSQPLAFTMIMLGSRAWEMLLLTGLLATLFITITIYFLDRREPVLKRPGNAGIHRLFLIFLVIAVIAGFFLVQPSFLSTGVNPLGKMWYKFAALFALIVIGALTLGIDALMLGEFREAAWGDLSKVSRTAILFSGVLGMWIVIVMGFVRESARAPWTIYGIIPVPGGESAPTPLSPLTIFGVWLVITASSLLIFWFTSRVTAAHPEKAEEM